MNHDATIQTLAKELSAAVPRDDATVHAEFCGNRGICVVANRAGLLRLAAECLEVAAGEPCTAQRDERDPELGYLFSNATGSLLSLRRIEGLELGDPPPIPDSPPRTGWKKWLIRAGWTWLIGCTLVGIWVVRGWLVAWLGS